MASSKTNIIIFFITVLLVLPIIASSNSEPVMTGEIPSQRISPGDSVTLDLDDYFEDPDGDDLIYTYTQPDNLTISLSDSVATIQVDENFSGQRVIIFNASDDEFNVSSNEVYVLVRPRKIINASAVNLPPVITDVNPSENPTILDVGESRSFSISAEDPEDDQINISWMLDQGLVSSGSLSYIFTADTPGQHVLMVTVADQSNYTIYTWYITVKKPQTIQKEVVKAAECGNGIIEEGEDCVSCPSDVQCAEGWECDTQSRRCVQKSSLNMVLIALGGGLVFILLIGFLLSHLVKKKIKKSVQETKPKLTPLSQQPKVQPKPAAQPKTVEVKKPAENPQQPVAQQPPQMTSPKVKTTQPDVARPTTQQAQPLIKPKVKQAQPLIKPESQEVSKIQTFYDQMKQLGKSDDEIKQKLLSAGWTQKQIDEEWAKLKTVNNQQ